MKNDKNAIVDYISQLGNKLMKRDMNFKRVIVLIILFFLFSIVFSSYCLADDFEDANKYAPIFYFEKEENYYPTNANYTIYNSYLYQVKEESPLLIDDTPTPSELANYNTDDHEFFYLDNYNGKPGEEGTISNYQKSIYHDQVIYYRVDNIDGNKVIQYWMFYAYNKGDLNEHEGDWEMVQVIIPDSGSNWVAYSQHHMGQKASWDVVEKNGNHIKVYVARGSHANYFRAYSGVIGLASDHVGDNGVIWDPEDYTLYDLKSQEWLNFRGKWGEIADSTEGAVTGSILGETGPEGPMYREGGEMYNSPVEWGNNLFEVNDLYLLAEYFLYNFVMIFIVITILMVLLILFFIYRRHKKYGLGPRKISILYIDGLNLKSIGNVLCIIGLVVVIIGLFLPWYGVSYELTGDVPPEFQTEGMIDAVKIDGLNGIQIIIPTANGPSPMGTFLLPFSLIIGIGLIFLILGSVGIFLSRKLGYKYIRRGIAVFLPIILLIVFIMIMGSMVPSDIGGTEETQDAEKSVSDVFNSISSSPFGGQENVIMNFERDGKHETAALNIEWGLQTGGTLLFLGGIILLISGIFEIFANTMFFEPKNLPEKHKQKRWYKKGRKQIDRKKSSFGQEPPLPQQQPPQQPPTNQKPDNKPPVSDIGFCTECGKKLKKGSEFCTSCGKKVE